MLRITLKTISAGCNVGVCPMPTTISVHQPQIRLPVLNFVRNLIPPAHATKANNCPSPNLTSIATKSVFRKSPDSNYISRDTSKRSMCKTAILKPFHTNRQANIQFSIRLRTALKMNPKEQQLSKWLLEMQNLGIVPDEVLGGQLVSMCRTAMELVELQKALPHLIWKSTLVFTNRIVVSTRIPGAALHVSLWLQEIDLCKVPVDELTGSALVSLCNTQADLALLQNTLPERVWNSTGVFTNRIMVSVRIRYGVNTLEWWLQEMQTCKTRPNEVTGNVLVSLCKSLSDLDALKRALPLVIWNDTHVFTSRMALSLRIPGAQRELTWWLQEMRSCNVKIDEKMGNALVSFCNTPGDLEQLQTVLPSVIRNSIGVFTNCILVSTRISGAKKSLNDWLREIRLCRIEPNEVTALVLLRLCVTPADLVELQSTVPTDVWMSQKVFASRISVSGRIPGGSQTLSWWLRDMQSCNFQPSAVTELALLHLCKTMSDLDALQMILSPAVWCGPVFFSHRLTVCRRIPGAARNLLWWLQELQLFNIQPDEITSTQLVSLCKTQADLDLLKQVIPVSLWNSTAVFSNRMLVSTRIPIAEKNLQWWLQEMSKWKIHPDEITGNVLISLCKTQEDLVLLQKTLPNVVWNSATVFTNRISVSERIPGAAHEIKWWLQELNSCNVQANEITGTQLICLCKTQKDMQEVQLALPRSVWNSVGVFNSRLVASTRSERPPERDFRWWLQEMNLCGVLPDEVTGCKLVSLCHTLEELTEVQNALPATVWNSASVFTNRIVTSKRILGVEPNVRWWIREMGNITPNEITGTQLASLCTTQEDLDDLQRALPVDVWNSNGVFINRMLVSTRIPDAEKGLKWWLREMQSSNLFPNEIAGNVLVSLCKTLGDILELQTVLPAEVWNTVGVFNNRVVISTRVPGADHELRWWLQEMKSCNVQPCEITGNVLVSLCKTQTDLVELQKALPAAIWNSAGVFSNRLSVSKRISGADCTLGWWLREMKLWCIQPDEIVGNLLVSLCATVDDLDELQKTLPGACWNSACVFNNRVVMSVRIPEAERSIDWWLQEMHSHGIQPSEITGTQLVSLCKTQEDFDALQKALPAAVWHSAGVFNNRVMISSRTLGDVRGLRWWLREMMSCSFKPGEITGNSLLAVCKTQSDLFDLENVLGASVWNSTPVFNNRVAVSARIPGSEVGVVFWLRELLLRNITADEITGGVLVSICKRQAELDELQQTLPALVWNTTGVFTNRIVISRQIQGAERELAWWLQEMHSSGIIPNERTGIQLLHMCKTEGDVLEVKQHVPPSVWNHPEVFNKRIKVYSNTLCLETLVSYWFTELHEGKVKPNSETAHLLLSLCRSRTDLFAVKRQFPKLIVDSAT